jgi:hypothetical protein
VQELDKPTSTNLNTYKLEVAPYHVRASCSETQSSDALASAAGRRARRGRPKAAGWPLTKLAGKKAQACASTRASLGENLAASEKLLQIRLLHFSELCVLSSVFRSDVVLQKYFWWFYQILLVILSNIFGDSIKYLISFHFSIQILFVTQWFFLMCGVLLVCWVFAL